MRVDLTLSKYYFALGNIYRETGYYIGWDEDTMFLVADEVGAKEGLVEETVNKAVQVGFLIKRSSMSIEF